MPRTLVTGATGFIGSRLVRTLLERGDPVACLVRPSSDTKELKALGAEVVVARSQDVDGIDAALRSAFSGDVPEQVLHLAGKTSALSLADFGSANEGLVDRLCAAVSGLGAPPVVVVVSSLAAAGPSTPALPHTEATPAKPISDYGRSKLAGERAARRWADRLPISIVRPPVVFGPGDRGGLAMCRAIRRLGIHFTPQRQGLPLSVVQVDDLIEALLVVAERGERVIADAPGVDDPTGLYYAADPDAISYAELGRMAAEAMGRRVWILNRRKYPLLLPAMAADAWAKVTGRPSLFGLDKLLEASASGWVCDPRKIVDGLGWRPAATIDERYRETIHAYQEAGWLPR